MPDTDSGDPPRRNAPTLPRSSPPSSLAFLVHSRETLEQNLEPEVDNKPLARQKRRRTSPGDQKILELEYQRNPKPDKATRLSIVRRVALGEKEVQIWFQNRRQSSRRRSQPLPMSDASDQSHCSFEDVNTDVCPSSDPAEEHNSTAEDASKGGNGQVETGSSVNVDAGPSGFPPVDASLPLSQPDALETQDTMGIPQSTADEQQGCVTPLTDLEASQSLSKMDERPDSESRSGENRKSVSTERFAYPHDSPESKVESSPNDDSRRRLRRTTSAYRLSMTADGQATVLARGEASPPPPSPEESGVISPSTDRSLTRSRSLFSFTTGAAVPQLTAGRSRDSRTWEFYCDNQSRNLLTQTADQENSGSAADAIGLLRSNSKKALQPNTSKRNAVVNASNPAKRQRVDGQSKTKLARASSSFGRLQSKAVGEVSSKAASGKSKKGAEEWEIAETESDKENRDPAHGATQRVAHSASQQNRPRKRILGENTTVLSESASLGVMMDREKRQKKRGTKETVDPEGDEEVASFMGGGLSSSRASVSSGEDLDCIQGLLSLSQGNWK